jgi:ubiquinone/menaquinone biosynthesis C-methylase UbiE
MPKGFTAEEIAKNYDAFARWYDLVDMPQEQLIAKRLRRRLLRRASEEVLEVAVGTGANFPYYPEGCRITAVDVSLEMLEVARRKAETLGLEVVLQVMDAEALSFPDESFDTVVSSMTVCTFPDPVAALKEMTRVCKPNGRILLLEHGRSDREWVGRLQDLREESHARRLGCHWNREPLELVEQAGLVPVCARRTFLGVFHEIEANKKIEEKNTVGHASSEEVARCLG